MKKIIIILSIILQAFTFGENGRLGEPIKQIESIKDGAGRMYLFTLGNDGKIYYVRQTIKNSPFNASGMLNNTLDSKGDYPGPLPTILFKQISVGLTYEGSIVVYGIDMKGNIKVCNQNKNNIDSWGNWLPNAGAGFSQQIIATKTDKTYQKVFSSKTDGSAAYNYMIVTNKGASDEKRQWGNWISLYGTNLKQLECAEVQVPSASGRWLVGHSILFALSNDGSVYKIEAGSNLTAWNNWVSLGGVQLKKINVSQNADGRLILFAIGGDNDAYERHQLSPGRNSEWSEWDFLEGSTNIKDISSCISQAGHIHLFGLHPDGSVDVTYQMAPGGNIWSGSVPFGGSQIQSIKCDRTENGRGVIYAIGGDGKVYYRWQAVPNGNWDDWVNLSTMFP